MKKTLSLLLLLSVLFFSCARGRVEKQKQAASDTTASTTGTNTTTAPDSTNK